MSFYKIGQHDDAILVILLILSDSKRNGGNQIFTIDKDQTKEHA